MLRLLKAFLVLVALLVIPAISHALLAKRRFHVFAHVRRICQEVNLEIARAAMNETDIRGCR